MLNRLLSSISSIRSIRLADTWVLASDGPWEIDGVETVLRIIAILSTSSLCHRTFPAAK